MSAKPAYTVATLPDPSQVSPGAQLFVSDGGNWRPTKSGWGLQDTPTVEMIHEMMRRGFACQKIAEEE